MMLELPARPSTLSYSNSLVASEATCCGFVCSGSAMYWTGRPLMPPLALTQSKTAFAVFVMSVKSTPGCFVMMAPILMAWPEAFWPLPLPHFGAAGGVAVVDPPPPPPLFAESLELSLPHAPTARASATAAIAASTRGPAGLNLVRNGPSPESDETGLRRPYRQRTIDRNQLFRSPERPGCDGLPARSTLAPEERRPPCPTHHAQPRRAQTTWGACCALRSCTPRSSASTRRSTPRCSPRSVSRT